MVEDPGSSLVGMGLAEPDGGIGALVGLDLWHPAGDDEGMLTYSEASKGSL